MACMSQTKRGRFHHSPKWPPAVPFCGEQQTSCWVSSSIFYIISEETSIFAPQRLPFYMALRVAACTVGKVRASTVFMCVCSMFRPSDFLLFVKNGFVVGVRCQGNREPPADGATTPLSQRHAWLALPKQ